MTNVTQLLPATIQLTTGTLTTVYVTAESGAPGPAGAQGPTGADGGAETQTFNTPATTHVVNHSLTYRPNVAVTTLGGAEIHGCLIDYVTDTRVDVTLNPATAVVVYLS